MSRQNFDATFCGRQPLHQTNQIQPHGAILVIEKVNMTVIQVSKNIDQLTSRKHEEILNRPVAELIDKESMQELESKSRSSFFRNPTPLILTFNGAQAYLALGHEKDDCIMIEIEFQNAVPVGSHSFNPIFTKLQTVMSAINVCSTIEEVATVAAREIKSLSGFDKVMIYSFDEEWNGTVIGEEMNEGMDSYLGLKISSFGCA